MNSTQYAFAVANVRAAENELLSSAFTEQLIESRDYEEACRLLADKGFDISSDPLDGYMNRVWNYLNEIAPDKDALKFLTVRNDFHNLKAILKGMIANTDGREYCITPCLIPIDELYSALTERAFDSLPEYISSAAAKAYEIITSSADGRLTDSFIDSCSYNAMMKLAKGNDFAENLADEIASLANIKTAVRAAKTNAGETVLNLAFNESRGIDGEGLKKAALRGFEQVSAYIEDSKYSLLAGFLSNSAKLEKECDNLITEALADSSRISFGIEPLAAYYFSSMAELKNLRLILRAKHAGLSAEIIRERLREIYV